MITVDHRDFTNALKRACKITPSSTSLPALRNVRLTLDEESITLRTTNLEIALVEILATSGHENGRVKPVSLCVPVAPLLGVVQALPQYLRDIPFEVRPDHVLVGTTKLGPGCTLDDYPTMPRVPERAQALIELPDDFMRHLRFVKTAVSHETIRHALQGVLFDFAHGNLVGCDGKRLHAAHLWEPTKTPSVIVPQAVFDIDTPTHMTIPKPDKDGSIRAVFFVIENGYLAAKTVDGTYPDYMAIVRKEHALTATADRAELASALEQALPMVNERSPSCVLHLNERFEIRAENADAGAEYANEVAAALDGPELKTSVNPHQLLGMLRTMSGELVTLAFRKPDEAIHVVNDAGDQWALLMPLTQPTPAPAKNTQ